MKKKPISKTNEYFIYMGIKRRCYSKTCNTYKNYGAKGIKMSAEWKKSYWTFFKDMGPRPSLNHSVDRIDGTKGYSKDNCRWATREEQSNNRRTTRMITHNGKTQTITQWGKELGMFPQVLNARLKKYPLEKALTSEHLPRFNRKGQPLYKTRKTIKYKGVTKTIHDWCLEYGLSKSMVMTRIRDYGWSFHRAITTPKIELWHSRKRFAGENNPKAKLTEKDVLNILKRLKKGQPVSAIEKDFSVRRSTLLLIRNGKIWTHLYRRVYENRS